MTVDSGWILGGLCVLAAQSGCVVCASWVSLTVFGRIAAGTAPPLLAPILYSAVPLRPQTSTGLILDPSCTNNVNPQWPDRNLRVTATLRSC